MSIDTVKKTRRITKDADPEFTREWVAWRQALALFGLGLPILPFSGDRYLTLDVPVDENEIDEMWLQRFSGASVAVPLGTDCGDLIALSVVRQSGGLIGARVPALPRTVVVQVGGNKQGSGFRLYRCLGNELPRRGGFMDYVTNAEFMVMADGDRILFHIPPNPDISIIVEAPEPAKLPDDVHAILARSMPIVTWDYTKEHGADGACISVPEIAFT